MVNRDKALSFWCGSILKIMYDKVNNEPTGSQAVRGNRMETEATAYKTALYPQTINLLNHDTGDKPSLFRPMFSTRLQTSWPQVTLLGLTCSSPVLKIRRCSSHLPWLQITLWWAYGRVRVSFWSLPFEMLCGFPTVLSKLIHLTVTTSMLQVALGWWVLTFETYFKILNFNLKLH